MNSQCLDFFQFALVIDRTSALSETSRTEFSAILYRKVRPKFGRTELSINHYSNDIYTLILIDISYNPSVGYKLYLNQNGITLILVPILFFFIVAN